MTMLHLAHHHVMREVMHMARRTVTLDDEVIRELDGLEGYRDVVWRAVESSPEEGHKLLVYLARSIDELGVRPSDSAVIRQAVDYYLSAIREAARMSQLETGYSALAADEERDDVIRALRSRMPERAGED